LAYCITWLTQRWHPAIDRRPLPGWGYCYVVVVIAGVVIGLGAPSALFFTWVSQRALRAEIVSTPRGGVAFPGLHEDGAPALLARIAATPSGDGYFFYPNLSMLPFLTGRKQVSNYDLFLPGYTLPSQYQDACTSVMRHASWVVIDRRWTNPDV